MLPCDGDACFGGNPSALAAAVVALFAVVTPAVAQDAGGYTLGQGLPVGPVRLGGYIAIDWENPASASSPKRR